MFKTKRRAFIMDPVCAFEFGHSLNAISYFAKLAQTRFGEVHRVASRHLPGDDGIFRFFEFHYAQHMAIAARPDRADPTGAIPYGRDPNVSSSEEFSRFLHLAQITGDDTLIFPSIDYYSIVGLEKSLSQLSPQLRPSVRVRLIGVMEGAGHGGVDTPDKISGALAGLRQLREEGCDIRICAETDRYRDAVAHAIGGEVTTLPYFVPGIERMPMPDAPVTFLAGGSARPDKGFFRLAELIQRVNAECGAETCRFIVQSMPEAPARDHQEYHETLAALPNVTLLPGLLSADALRDSFAASHVILMPYDQDIYRLRGSGMLMEALLYGRLAIGPAATGFGEQIRTYGAGALADTDDEFIAAIRGMIAMGVDGIAERATHARETYLADVQAAAVQWLDRPGPLQRLREAFGSRRGPPRLPKHDADFTAIHEVPGMAGAQPPAQSGWSTPEGALLWARADCASRVYTVAAPVRLMDLRLRMRGRHPMQVSVRLAGVDLGHVSLTEMVNEFGWGDLNIPVNDQATLEIERVPSQTPWQEPVTFALKSVDIDTRPMVG